MDIVNFDALKAQGKILDLADVNPEEDYLIIGKHSNKYTTDSFKSTKYPIYAIRAGDVLGVQSVTGLNTDNTDPYNPIVKISVDGVTITGQGTPASPLVAVDPRPYKVYTALLNQTGTDAPQAIVLENTIGDITWTYENAGVYYANSSNLFNGNIFISPYIYYNNEIDAMVVLSSDPQYNTNNILQFLCSANNSGIDGRLINVPIEIRVYN